LDQTNDSQRKKMWVTRLPVCRDFQPRVPIRRLTHSLPAQTGDWKVARTGRLESLPYIQWRRFTELEYPVN
jgi:hypothetical protein